ncbi:MAG: molybdopterin synthase sulfur carrier subunit [Rhodocyclales bacterium GWA2_65_20]|nr:MAG: molybdopterin synthase sulfur carrier subunit [Rhodocyclales bacterium GWA2_65_20]
MKITFKLYATFSDYLPDAARKTNALALDVEDGVTVAALIERYKLPPGQCHLVLIDGVFVPPQQRSGRILRAGETLAIWPPVAGG